MNYKTEMNRCPKCGELARFDDFFCQNCGTPLTSPERPRTKQYMSYIQVIGIVEIVMGVFSFFIGGMLGFVSYLLPQILEISEIQSEISDPVLIEIIGYVRYILIFIVILIFIYGIFALISGIRLLQYKNSGRIGTMVIGALSLLNIPLGTIFGVAALYILTKPEVEAIFS